MAFYIRKAVSFGPVRFNLSKKGVGTSVGVTGFRVGVRPNGKSYLHAGRYGLYCREELGGGESGRKQNQVQYSENESANELNTTKYNTASSQALVPNSKKELLSKLNNSYKSFRIDYLCGITFIILSYFGFQTNKIIGVSLIVAGIVATTLVAYWETKRRSVVITYDFEDGKASQFQKLISAFNHLASSKVVWSLVDSRNISGTHESKLNAGAGNLVNKTEAMIGEGKPPWVETNVTIPVIKTRGQALYMMPDGILVYDSCGVGFVEYNDVNTYYNTTRFIEKRPPADAYVVDKTWLHPNKNGGPDRRFSNNYKIPICLFGKLQIKSSSGLFLYLMTSKHDSASKFMKEFESATKTF